MERNEKLQALAEQATGLHYDSADTQAILDRADWSDYWPVVDGRGLLTGDIVDSGDGCANVADVAMVRLDDLTPEQRASVSDGYVTL